MSSLLLKLKNNYTLDKRNFDKLKKIDIVKGSEYNNSQTEFFDNFKIIETTTEKRERIILNQVNHIYNIGDSELRNSLKTIKNNNYNITYKHMWSSEGNAVGTIGGELNIYFYKNFCEKPQIKFNEFSHSEIMKYAGCITLEGAIRSMLIHELGHVHFRTMSLNNKWVSTLKHSHSKLWSNWVALKIIKFNNIVAQSCPELLIGFTIFKGFNNTYENPDTEILEMLNGQYFNILKPNGYFADPIIFPNINSPFDW